MKKKLKNKYFLTRIIITISIPVLISFSFKSNHYSKNIPQVKTMEIKLTSTAFKEGENIPSKYTCEGVNISPELKWKDSIKEARTYAIILDDPDAPGGDFVHWVIYNIPSNIYELHEDITPTRNIPDEVMQGTNSFGRIGYRGPCPPEGNAHRYFFRIYALDTALHLKDGAEKYQLEKAMQGHIIAQGKLMGMYKRQL